MSFDRLISVRPLIFPAGLLMGCGLLMTTAVAEDRREPPSSTVELRNIEAETDPGNDSKRLPVKIGNTPVSKQKKHSIKMIVGGQSEDGLAKQLTLTVGD